MRTGREEGHSLSLTIATVVLFCNKHDYISRDLRSSYDILVSQVKSIVACIWSAAVERLRNGAVSVCPSVCPVERQRQRRAAAGLPQLGRGQQISIDRAAAAGSVDAVIRGGGSAQIQCAD